MDIRVYQPGDEEAVIHLWQRCDLLRAWNNPHKDIQRKLDDSPDLFLVGLLGEQVVAAVLVGYEGHRGWISYLGVDPDHQRKGLGRMLMEEAERRLRERGCPKINLQVRESNLGVIAFYQSLGFTLDPVVSLGKRLEHDGPRNPQDR